MMEQKLSVVIPCYNEQGSIGQTVAEVKTVLREGNIRGDVLVVDDGSTDRSGDCAEEGGARVLSHGANRGYGEAILTGVRKASTPLVAIMDGDGTYPADAIPYLLERMKACDMVVGARTGRDVHVPPIRRPAKWILRRLACVLAETEIPDLNSGLRIFRRDVFFRFVHLYPRGFSLTTTLTLALLCNGYAVKFYPIDYRPRKGKSKIRPIRDTLGFLKLIMRIILIFNPLKILAPLSYALFLLGGAKLLIDLYRFSLHVATSTIVILLGAFQIFLLGFLADLFRVTAREIREQGGPRGKDGRNGDESR
jgi:glycosyltransferase involved in cell wall biosynthesis